MTHYLKCDQPYYSAVLDGSKPFEIRRDDRGFSVGDVPCLNETTRDARDLPVHTGRFTVRIVTYITDFPEGLRPGYVVLGIK